MNRRNRVILRLGQILLAVLIVVHVQPLHAGPAGCQDVQVDDTGTIIGERPARITGSPLTRTLASSMASSVSILMFYPFYDTPERLQGLGYTVTETTNDGDLTQENLRNYDVLWIDVDGTYYSLESIEEIQAWIAEDGGGVILVQPNYPGPTLLFPPGFEVTVDNGGWPGYPSEFGYVHIIDGTHPITEGITDYDAGANADWVWWDDIGPSWHVLAVDAMMPDDVVALLAGEYGEGRMVFSTGNYGTSGWNGGSDQFVLQLLTWLSQKEPPPQPWSVAATVGGAGGEGTDAGGAGGAVARDSSMLNHLAFLLLPMAVVVVLRRVRRRG